ncbi:hypothetical protein ACM66B_004010 [Microbotryomycetes sp. NB124-2]
MSPRTSTRVRRPPIGVPYQPPKRRKYTPVAPTSAATKAKEQQTEATTTTEQSPKKKRGRPRKHPLPEDHVETNSVSPVKKVKKAAVKRSGAELSKTAAGKQRAREDDTVQQEEQQLGHVLASSPTKRVQSPKKRQTPKEVSDEIDKTNWRKLSRQAKVEVRTLMEQSFKDVSSELDPVARTELLTHMWQLYIEYACLGDFGMLKCSIIVCRVDQSLSEMLVPPIDEALFNGKGETDLPTEDALLAQLAELGGEKGDLVGYSQATPQVKGSNAVGDSPIKQKSPAQQSPVVNKRGRAPRAAGRIKRAKSGNASFE